MKVRKICVKPDAKLTTRWVKGPNFWWFHPRLTSAETFAPSSPARARFCARWELRRSTCHQKVCARFAQKSANVFRVETSPQTFCWKKPRGCQISNYATTCFSHFLLGRVNRLRALLLFTGDTRCSLQRLRLIDTRTLRQNAAADFSCRFLTAEDSEKTRVKERCWLAVLNDRCRQVPSALIA